MQEMLFAVILFLISFIICSLGLIYIRAYFDPVRKIPGPPLTRPIFGNFLEFVWHGCPLIKTVKAEGGRFGPIRIWNEFFGKAKVIVSSQQWIKYVFNSKNFQRGDFPGAENVFLAVGENSLIVTNGEVHKKLRKLATPAFKHSSLKKVMPTIEMCGQRMVNLFKLCCDESETKIAEITVKEILNKTTLDVIGLMAFDHDFKEACSFDKNTFGCHLREWMDEGIEIHLDSILPYQLLIKRFMIKVSRSMSNFLPNTRGFRLAITTNKIHDLVEGIVQSKIEEWRTGKFNETADRNKTLLHFILDHSDTVELNNAEIHDLLMTFLVAGHETSTLSITWTLYLLAKHPNYQEKCRQEVNNFFALHQPLIEWDTVKSLPFLNAVVHESLRLYPPVAFLHRVNVNADEIAGYYIPPKTDILIIILEMHRNAEYWANPEEFIPERFLEPHDTIPWDAFMPFGDGVHKCIGYQLSLTETIYFLALLLKHFHFSIDETVEYHDYAGMTLHPRPALKLHFKLL